MESVDTEEAEKKLIKLIIPKFSVQHKTRQQQQKGCVWLIKKAEGVESCEHKKF